MAPVGPTDVEDRGKFLNKLLLQCKLFLHGTAPPGRVRPNGGTGPAQGAGGSEGKVLMCVAPLPPPHTKAQQPVVGW